MSAHIDG